MSSAKQNTFKASDFVYDKDKLIDCSNKTPLWMHNIARQESSKGGDIAMSFGIFFAFIAFVGCLFYCIGQYPKAYPPKGKQFVKTYSKP